MCIFAGRNEKNLTKYAKHSNFTTFVLSDDCHAGEASEPLGNEAMKRGTMKSIKGAKVAAGKLAFGETT